MKKILSFTLAALAATYAALADSAVIVNTANSSPNAATVGEMLTGKKKFWDGGSEVVIAVIKDDAVVDSALQKFTGMDSSRFKNHWQRLAFSGRGRMPKTFDSSDAIVAFVKQNPGAIGIVPSGSDTSAVTQVN